MTATHSVESSAPKVRTGRRVNPAIDGPRDNTVCFMLSDGEKFNLDRLAFCLNLTRSGVLSNIVAEFVTATEGNKEGRQAAKRLEAYLKECRDAVKRRGDFATKSLQELEGSQT